MADGFLVHRPESGPHGIHGHRVDVTAEGGEAEFVGLADRRPRPHERVENGHVGEGVGAVELLGQGRLLV